MSPEPLVRLDHLEKRYSLGEVEIKALNDVCLSLPAGEFIVFIGPSGSGKTTLLNVIGGLDPPTSGEVVVAGHNLSKIGERELTLYRRDVVGFIFQFYNLIPTLTARENVELVAEQAANPLDARDALKAVGLADRADHFPAALSGGEQQRVAIARALVKRPALVLADEPTGNLDYETGIQVLDVMHEAIRGVARSILLVTHNQEITRMADRTVHLRSGRIAEVRVNSQPLAPRELHW